MAVDNETLERISSTPINDAEPTGGSAKYEPEYERLTEEFEKQQSMSGESTDWDVVVENAIAVLETHSKDLLVASYLLLGLFQTRGYEGLAGGLSLINELGRGFGADLFPKRVRARVSALEMAGEKLAQMFKERQPTEADHPAVIVAKGLYDALPEALEAALDGQQIDFRDFRNAFNPLAQEAERAEKAKREAAVKAEEEAARKAAEPDQAAATPAPAATAAAATPASAPAAAPGTPAAVAVPGAIGNSDEFIKAAGALGKGAATLAAFMREQDPRAPFPYLLVRAATWNDLAQLPADNDGVFGFPGPGEPEINAVKQRLQNGEYSQLIGELEAMAVHPIRRYWLDAHRHLVGALDGLGESKAAISAVKAGLAAILHRFPRLLELRFANTTPFADDQTRAWIQSEVLVERAGGGGGDGGSRPEVWRQSAAKATKMAAKGKFNEGAALFSEGRATAASARERFLWELEQARYCQQAGRNDLSRPLLGHLDGEVERFSLEEWEPELAVDVARLLVAAEGKSPPAGDAAKAAARRERLHARLCRFDIGAAIEVIPKK